MSPREPLPAGCEVDAKDADRGLDLAISDFKDSRASSDVEGLSEAGVLGLELCVGVLCLLRGEEVGVVPDLITRGGGSSDSPLSASSRQDSGSLIPPNLIFSLGILWC